jgi:hypothetical protein
MRCGGKIPFWKISVGSDDDIDADDDPSTAALCTYSD